MFSNDQDHRGLKLCLRLLKFPPCVKTREHNLKLCTVGLLHRAGNEAPLVDSLAFYLVAPPPTSTKAGSVSKVNAYVVVRDLGRGSSAEVKLCRLVPHHSTLPSLAGTTGDRRVAEDPSSLRQTSADTPDEDDLYVSLTSNKPGLERYAQILLTVGRSA